MREEISEPQQWRSRTRSESSSEHRRNTSKAARSVVALPVDAVDAAFADELTIVEPARGSRRDPNAESRSDSAQNDSQTKSVGHAELLQNLSVQLAMLDAQREQLQRLLAQAQDN